MASLTKRSLTIAGHRTSLSLEPEFWEALKAEAHAAQKSLSQLASEIDQARGTRNLSSAIRVWLLAEVQRRAQTPAIPPAQTPG